METRRRKPGIKKRMRLRSDPHCLEVEGCNYNSNIEGVLVRPIPKQIDELEISNADTSHEVNILLIDCNMHTCILHLLILSSLFRQFAPPPKDLRRSADVAAHVPKRMKQKNKATRSRKSVSLMCVSLFHYV